MTDQFDMGSLLEQAQAMQQRLMEAQAAAAEQVVEVQAGGGVVRVTVTGGLEFRSVKIDPRVVDPTDVEMLEDLVLVAVNEAQKKASDLAKEEMSRLTGGLNLPFKLPF